MPTIFSELVALPAGISIGGAIAQELSGQASGSQSFIFTIPSGYNGLVHSAWASVNQNGGPPQDPNSADAVYVDGDGKTMFQSRIGFPSPGTGLIVQFAWSINGAGIAVTNGGAEGSLPPLLLLPGGTFEIDLISVPAAATFDQPPRAFATLYPAGRSGRAVTPPSLIPTPAVR